MDSSSSFIPLKPRVRRKRRADLPSAVPVTGVTVVSVTLVAETGGTQVVWLFSSAVVDVSDPSGLIVGGQSPDTVIIITAEGGLQIAYLDPLSVGDTWMATAPGTQLTFENGQPLVLPESGVVG
jgi:hypothetical protein